MPARPLKLENDQGVASRLPHPPAVDVQVSQNFGDICDVEDVNL